MNRIYAGLGQLLQSATNRPKIKEIALSIRGETEELIDKLIECYKRNISTTTNNKKSKKSDK